ncbi:MAG: CoA transferase, partial [Pikeienuella sp.]
MTSPLSQFPAYSGPADAKGPLAGLRVVDFTHFVAGPFCSMTLADMGAEVIKVEAPRGEAFRNYGPARQELDNQGAAFLWANRNKKGIVLDMKCEAGAGVAR